MSELKYIIGIAPITKKNSQQILVNRVTGKPFISPSRQYKEYENTARWFVRPLPPHPIDYAVNVRCVFYMPTRRRVDLNNLLEAVTDLLVHTGVLADDHSGIVAGHDGSRVKVDKTAKPRTEIYITRMTEE